MKQTQLKAIPTQQTESEPPQPGYLYKKKPIPHFPDALIDFSEPSAVKARLAELKKRRASPEIEVNNWWKKLLKQIK